MHDFTSASDGIPADISSADFLCIHIYIYINIIIFVYIYIHVSLLDQLSTWAMSGSTCSQLRINVARLQVWNPYFLKLVGQFASEKSKPSRVKKPPFPPSRHPSFLERHVSLPWGCHACRSWSPGSCILVAYRWVAGVTVIHKTRLGNVKFLRMMYKDHSVPFMAPWRKLLGLGESVWFSEMYPWKSRGALK